MKTNNSPDAHTVSPEVEPGEILVAVDFSESSGKALRHAAGLAARNKAHLTVLNVVEDPDSFRMLDLSRQQHQLRHEHTLQLRELTRRELGPDNGAHLLVSHGDPSTEIARVAARQHAGLIVVSLHKSQGLSRWFSRHTADRLIREAPCPVMVLNDELSEPAPATTTT